MQPLSWYMSRISLMSPGEVVWRAKVMVGDLAEKRLRLPRVPHKVPASTVLAHWSAPKTVNASLYREAGARVLDGYVDLFGTWRKPIGAGPINWNADPIGGTCSPTVHGKFLDYRDARLCGSARNTWELNRHYQLVTLGQAWASTGAEEFRRAASELVETWIDSCPYPLGINWTSALEHGIRLINWYMGSRLLAWWDEGVEPVANWGNSIHQHCRFIFRNQSRYSSANNHLIGEMAGLYIASTAWSFGEDSRNWRSKAKAILESEAIRQIASDGVLHEQAVGYQAFVIQFLVLAGLVGESNGDAFSAQYWNRIRRAIGFMKSIADVRGNLPMFGDADDGVVHKLATTDGPRMLSELLALDDWLSSGASPVEGTAAHWLSTGFQPPTSYERGRLQPATCFPEGGYYVLEGRRDNPDSEVLLVSDAGPLGFLSIAAHGHADCLSFTLSFGGRQVLIDPGTYCYHDDPKWRSYFRGTSAHNTVRVDGVDQSVSAGPFMWLEKAVPKVEIVETAGAIQSIRASHDGYRRLSDPVIHRRELRLDVSDQSLTVTDELLCESVHSIERFWHFAEEFEVTGISPGLVELASPHTKVSLRFSDASVASVHRSSTDPRAGWVSRKFGSMSACVTIIVRDQMSGTSRLPTVFNWAEV